MDNHQPRLTSAELSQLWTAYMNDSMGACVLKHMLQTVKDADIRLVIESGLQQSQTHVQKIKSIFQTGNQPVPVGFTDQDVDLTAPRLYTDEFMINEVREIAQLGLVAYAQSLSFSSRPDIQDYFAECLNESKNLRKQAMNVLLSKGLYVRAPYITTPDQVDFVTKQSFLSGFFGDKRPLLSLEIANLYDNMQRNALGKELLTGFQQVARSKKVQQYMKRGKEISAKHIEIFGSVLRQGDVPASVPWDTGVTNSTTPPVSDKLMMFQATALNAIGIAYYGTAMSTSMRTDLTAHYARLAAEIGKYTEDGANLMIENGWLEEPPRTVDHNQLAKE